MSRDDLGKNSGFQVQVSEDRVLEVVCSLVYVDSLISRRKGAMMKMKKVKKSMKRMKRWLQSLSLLYVICKTELLIILAGENE